MKPFIIRNGKGERFMVLAINGHNYLVADLQTLKIKYLTFNDIENYEYVCIYEGE